MSNKVWIKSASKHLLQPGVVVDTVIYKNATFWLWYKSHVAWAIFILSVPAETGMNTLQISYTVYNSTLSTHYLQTKNNIKPTACFQRCIFFNQLFITFAECRPVLVFSNSCWEILLVVFWQYLSHSNIKILYSKINIFNFNKHHVLTVK